MQAKLPGLAMIYDFAVTDNFAVFVQPVLKVNGMQYMLGKEPGKTISMEGEPSVSSTGISVWLSVALSFVHMYAFMNPWHTARSHCWQSRKQERRRDTNIPDSFRRC